MATRAPPSATNSPTVSTMKAANLTRTATCATGGRRKTAKQFEQRASCISDQYSQYVAVDDIKINGQLTMGENVADLGGLMLAYMAWQERNSRQEAGSDRRLYPGTTLLYRLRTELVLSDARRNQTHVRHHRSALSGQISSQRRSFQHPGISAGISLQSRFGDGEGKSLQSVVKGGRRSWSLALVELARLRGPTTAYCRSFLSGL